MVTFAVELDARAPGLQDVRDTLQRVEADFPTAQVRVVESRADRRPRPPRPVRIRTGHLHAYE